eukprot:1158122-Pelagomonas_calceolata.AAC.26
MPKEGAWDFINYLQLILCEGALIDVQARIPLYGCSRLDSSTWNLFQAQEPRWVRKVKLHPACCFSLHDAHPLQGSRWQGQKMDAGWQGIEAKHAGSRYGMRTVNGCRALMGAGCVGMMGPNGVGMDSARKDSSLLLPVLLSSSHRPWTLPPRPPSNPCAPWAR